MAEDLSVQILSQTSDNIQKLFDLSTRIDERVKSIQNKQQDMNSRIDAVVASYNELNQAVAILKSSADSSNIEECKRQIVDIDKRLTNIEHRSEGMENRWTGIFKFIVQIIWLVVGAWILFKLGLAPPPLP